MKSSPVISVLAIFTMKKRDDLDTETTFAEMNIEGFRWYNPKKKKGEQSSDVTNREYWAMVWGAFRAFLPVFVIICEGFGIIVALAYLWLG